MYVQPHSSINGPSQEKSLRFKHVACNRKFRIENTREFIEHRSRETHQSPTTRCPSQRGSKRAQTPTYSPLEDASRIAFDVPTTSSRTIQLLLHSRVREQKREREKEIERKKARETQEFRAAIPRKRRIVEPKRRFASVFGGEDKGWPMLERRTADRL